MKESKKDQRLGDAIFKIASQTEEIKTLQERLDRNQTILWDTEETCKRLTIEIESLNAQVAATQARNVLCNENHNIAEQKWVDKFNKLEADLKTANTTIQMRNNEIYTLRNGKVADEHLARKLLELVADKNSLDAKVTCLSTENSLLKQQIAKLKEDEKAACEIIAKNNDLAKMSLATSDEVIKLRAEVNTFKEQNSRLIDESRKYSCPGSRSIADDMPLCGECLSCKLSRTQKILEQTSVNYTKANDERNNLAGNLERKIKAYSEQEMLNFALEGEKSNLKEIIRLYKNAIERIATSGIFGKKRKIAFKVEKDIADFKQSKSMM